MSLNIRRVVTGHDDQGRAKVMIDERVRNVISQRPGALYSVIWSSDGFPVDNDIELDPSGKKIAYHDPQRNGVSYRQLRPRCRASQPSHRFDRLCGRHVG